MTNEEVMQLAGEIADTLDYFKRSMHELDMARGDLPMEDRVNEDAENERLWAGHTATLRLFFERYNADVTPTGQDAPVSRTLRHEK